MQDMAGGRAREAATSSLGGGESSSVASGQLTSSSQFPSTQSYWDSDFETEPDPPDWRHSINQEELAQLNPREKQRQDVINGESNSNFRFRLKKFFRGKQASKYVARDWYFCYQNCSSDQEKLLKFEAEDREFSKCLRSLEQFIRTVKGQNNFW